MSVTLIGAIAAVLVARNRAAEVALQCWQKLADKLQTRIDELTAKLARIEAQLEEERARNVILENKVRVLEAQRARLKVDLQKAQHQIAELKQVNVDRGLNR